MSSFDEIAGRIAKGPVAFKLLVQVAKDGDVVDDATVHWPADRALRRYGATGGVVDARRTRSGQIPRP